MVDFSKGGYQGDTIEEMFKGFTSKHFPYWWHFREVLRASVRAQIYWQDVDGNPLGEEEVKELVALSLMNYHVYTCLGEALSFYEDMLYELKKHNSPSSRIFEVRKNWKASYSSIYSSFNALCNLVVVAVGKAPVLKVNKRGEFMNYMPKSAIDLVRKNGKEDISDLLDECKKRLDIRNHLDYYWIIWHGISQGSFLLDKNFQKGYLVTNPKSEVEAIISAPERLYKDLKELQPNIYTTRR